MFGKTIWNKLPECGNFKKSGGLFTPKIDQAKHMVTV